jgi:hypothetical protein
MALPFSRHVSKKRGGVEAPAARVIVKEMVKENVEAAIEKIGDNCESVRRVREDACATPMVKASA